MTKPGSEGERQDVLYNGLSTRAVARRLMVSTTHLYELVDQKELRALDVSKKGSKRRSLRFREEWIVEFEQKRNTAA